MYEYNAIVTHVVDGDTYDLWVDVGFDTARKVRVRLKDFDTPEVYHASCPAEREHGKQAKQFVAELILGKKVLIKTHKDSKGRERRGSFRRWLADVYLYPDMVSLADKLRENGFAKKEVY